METVVVLQIISNFFWLILVVLVIGVFGKQLRSLLDSLGSFEFAGVQLLFPRDKKGSLEQSAILSEVLLQLLEQRDASEHMIPLLSDKSARRLGTFAVRYAQDVPEDNQEVEVILNVAMILGRKERYSDAMQIIEAHLKNHPDDLDANQQKALWLFATRVPAKVRSADKILDRLVDMYPTKPTVWFNRALTRSLLEKYDLALSDLKRAIERAYWSLPGGTKMLADSSLVPLKRAKPSEFKQIEDELSRIIAGDLMAVDDRGAVVLPAEGKTISFSGNGVRFVYKEPEGAYSVVEFVAAPGAPLHLHRATDEALYVLEGTLGFQVGQRTLELTEGAFVLVVE